MEPRERGESRIRELDCPQKRPEPARDRHPSPTKTRRWVCCLALACLAGAGWMLWAALNIRWNGSNGARWLPWLQGSFHFPCALSLTTAGTCTSSVARGTILYLLYQVREPRHAYGFIVALFFSFLFSSLLSSLQADEAVLITISRDRHSSVRLLKNAVPVLNLAKTLGW